MGRLRPSEQHQLQQPKHSAFEKPSRSNQRKQWEELQKHQEGNIDEDEEEREWIQKQKEEAEGRIQRTEDWVTHNIARRRRRPLSICPRARFLCPQMEESEVSPLHLDGMKYEREEFVDKPHGNTNEILRELPRNSRQQTISLKTSEVQAKVISVRTNK